MSGPSGLLVVLACTGAATVGADADSEDRDSAPTVSDGSTTDSGPPPEGVLAIENATTECVSWLEICEPLGLCDLLSLGAPPYECLLGPGETYEEPVEVGTRLLVVWNEAVDSCLVTQEAITAGRTTHWTVNAFYPCPEGIGR